MTIESDAIDYYRNRPRDRAAAEVLRALVGVVGEHAESAQLRSLAFESGRILARWHPLPECATLAEFEQAADSAFREADWGTLRAEPEGGEIVFVHGAPPLQAWFGADHGVWSEGLFEGILAEWLQHLGAGDTLDVRSVDSDDGHSLRYRFAHRSHFAAAARETKA
ncbi:hypothetical protein [Algiphilus sp.]|uniref:cellulose biosynthesis protein BcsD n=1 Tax=Algiphilus sp. TaxID=1872431 RepID=UPI0025BDF496|nr:hypothetical protein [Algiphilus sp.]MCK5770106.1 hypothetical protein [Algiphilus sp.]